jgi:hypothetical protein
MTVCAAYLKSLRKRYNVPKEDKIDKRYHGPFGWLAPDDQYYNDHCGHCAEVKYLHKKYFKKSDEQNEKETN